MVTVMRTHSHSPRRPSPRRMHVVIVASCWMLLASAALAAAPRLVVSIPPYEDLVRRVAGPEASVTVLLPPGASPHTFEPSPSQMRTLREADLVILNGGVDDWVRDLVDAAGGEARTFVAMETAGGEDVDPHVWLDPLRMVPVMEALAADLAELDPDGAEGYRARGEEVGQALRALHERLASILEPVAGAAFVPFHDAWSHFADRYGLDLVMEIEPFPGREPSPRRLAQAVAAIRDSGARAIFNEAQLPDRPARVLADEARVEVFTLDPLGGVEGRRSYEALMRHNARVVARALAPSSP